MTQDDEHLMYYRWLRENPGWFDIPEGDALDDAIRMQMIRRGEFSPAALVQSVDDK